jgi:hypothetical protein
MARNFRAEELVSQSDSPYINNDLRSGLMSTVVLLLLHCNRHKPIQRPGVCFVLIGFFSLSKLYIYIVGQFSPRWEYTRVAMIYHRTIYWVAFPDCCCCRFRVQVSLWPGIMHARRAKIRWRSLSRPPDNAHYTRFAITGLLKRLE